MRLLDAIWRSCLPGRKRSGDAASSEQLFRGAFEHAPIGMALTDLDGKFTHVNRALCELVGYSQSELLSRDILAITHPDDLKQTSEKLDTLRSGKLPSYHYSKR